MTKLLDGRAPKPAPAMYIRTMRDVLASVPDRWFESYGERIESDWTFYDGTTPGEHWERLEQLDPATCTAADIKAIVGNDSWTTNDCDTCTRSDAPAVVCIVPQHDYSDGSISASICTDCFLTAAQGMSARSDETQGRLGPQGQQPDPKDAPTPRPEAGEGVE